ncbi:MAG: radical SAM protein [Pseudomonadota bacterium]
MHTSIALTAFRELWIHTGTACNLSCPFCHEGSRPGDMRIEPVTLAEIAPQLDVAATLGVERFAFTGGEPLILKDIHAILLHALSLRPALVLTNGTAPLIRRAHHLASLRAAPNALSFRVSIDYPDEARHDAGRGLRNFRKALDGLRLLHEAGFATGITRMLEAGEDRRAVENRFRNLLRRQRLPEDLPIVALPELGLPQPDGALVPYTQSPSSPPTSLPTPGCSRSRMLLRRNGSLRIAPCALVDDTPALEFETGLAESLKIPARALHARCAQCLSQGVDYVGIGTQESC